MTLVRQLVTNAAVGVGIADDPANLDAFLKPGCAAAIWRRQMPKDVKTWLDALDPNLLPRGRRAVAAHAAAETFDVLCQQSGLPQTDELTWLREDVAALAARFSDLMSATFLRLRVDVITTNACRKFHIDAITARLLCTYRGPGTQYGVSTDGHLPKRVFSVQTGSPILLRGTDWPGHPKSGLLHRSPPIEGTKETRLVLVLDPLKDLANDG